MEIFGAAALGALFQEFMYWYGKRFEIRENGVQGNLSGWLIYGVIVLVATLASSAGAYIWLEDRADVPLKDAMILGAAFPALFKLAVKGASTASSHAELGFKDGIRKVAKAYFK